MSFYIISFLIKFVVKGNGLIENLFDQRTDLNDLHKMLDTEVTPIKTKLAAMEKA